MGMNKDEQTATWEEVLGLVDDKIPPNRAEHLKEHLRDCQECRERLEGTERVAAESDEKRQNERAPFSGFTVLMRRFKGPLLILGGVVVLGLLALLGRQMKIGDLPATTRPQQIRESMALPASQMAAKSEAGSTRSEEEAQVDENLIAQGYAPAIATTPMIARSVTLQIVAKEFAAARASLEILLAKHHGYAAELTVNTQQGSARSLQASLRIPTQELTAAMAEVKALGTVESESQKGEEVTQQHADLSARLKNARDTEQRLQAILQQRTGKVSDVLTVEQEISRVRGEIEGMEAELKGLEHRVDFATVDLTINEEYQAQLGAPSLPTRFRNAVVDGLQRAADTIVGIALFGMNYGPVLLFWLAILIVPVRFGWKHWRVTRLKTAN
jgi:hypothetical protein